MQARVLSPNKGEGLKLEDGKDGNFSVVYVYLGGQPSGLSHYENKGLPKAKLS